jgi:hypothetical protein
MVSFSTVLACLYPIAAVIGVVGRAIVEEKHLVDLVPNLLRNAIERPIEFVNGVVRNDENADALLAHETPLLTRYTFSGRFEACFASIVPREKA